MKKNIAASIHQRLLNRSKSDQRPFNEMLQYYAIERFLYRLSQSNHADKFILKGAMLFKLWDLFQSMVKRGEINSRMKDFYDIWALSRQFNFTGDDLSRAISQTFQQRETKIPKSENIESFSPDFARNKKSQWQAFKENSLGYETDFKKDFIPNDFNEIIMGINRFLSPIIESINSNEKPPTNWIPPDKWEQ